MTREVGKVDEVGWGLLDLAKLFDVIFKDRWMSCQAWLTDDAGPRWNLAEFLCLSCLRSCFIYLFIFIFKWSIVEFRT